MQSQVIYKALGQEKPGRGIIQLNSESKAFELFPRTPKVKEEGCLQHVMKWICHCIVSRSPVAQNHKLSELKCADDSTMVQHKTFVYGTYGLFNASNELLLLTCL